MSKPAHSEIYDRLFARFVERRGRMSVQEFAEVVNDAGGDHEDVILFRAAMEREGLRRVTLAPGSDLDWPLIRELFTFGKL